MQQTTSNKSYRKIVLYTTLPSNGEYWPQGTINISNPSKEIGIMPMTMLDEMNMRTPDALMNGEAIVAMIKSCCPDISDPWQAPLLDIETILVGIRVATYGPTLTVSTKIPVVNEVHEFSIDLSEAVSNLTQGTFKQEHVLQDGTAIKIRPMTYRTMTQTNIKNYEQARLATNLRSTDATEADKIAEIQKAFKQIASMTVQNIVDQIVSIKTPDAEYSMPNDVYEFVTNVPAPVAQEIKAIVTEQNKIGTMKPVNVQVPPQFVEKGAPKTVEQNLILDQSNFFVLS